MVIKNYAIIIAEVVDIIDTDNFSLLFMKDMVIIIIIIDSSLED